MLLVAFVYEAARTFMQTHYLYETNEEGGAWIYVHMSADPEIHKVLENSCFEGGTDIYLSYVEDLLLGYRYSTLREVDRETIQVTREVLESRGITLATPEESEAVKQIYTFLGRKHEYVKVIY